jgi:hypothetical protein
MTQCVCRDFKLAYQNLIFFGHNLVGPEVLRAVTRKMTGMKGYVFREMLTDVPLKRRWNSIKLRTTLYIPEDCTLFLP